LKYGFSQKLFGYFYHSSCMKQAKRHHLQIDSKAIKQEYRAILTRAKDIGKSRLMSSYCMGAYFIALNRNTTLSRRNVMPCIRTASPLISCSTRSWEMQTAISMRRSFQPGKSGLPTPINTNTKMTGSLTS